MYQVVGIRSYDFEKEGKRFSGKSFYCLYDDVHIEGQGTEKFNVSSAINTSCIKVGSIINPVYNRFGRITSLEVVQ